MSLDRTFVVVCSAMVFGAPVVACGSDNQAISATPATSPDPTTPTRTGTSTPLSSPTTAGTTTPQPRLEPARVTLGGTVSGIIGGGLVLADAAGGEVSVLADGAFLLPNKVTAGAAYAVTVKTQPSGPTQTCEIAGGTGVVVGGDVTTVVVSCATNRFAIGGTVSGLGGIGLVLQNKGGNDTAVNANGSMAFSSTVPSGTKYDITVATQPRHPTQTCTVAGGTGTVGSAAIKSPKITCTTNEYIVGGTVTGLSGSGLVLHNSFGDDVTVAADGSFRFGRKMASGTPFSISVGAQPTGPSQACVVSGGSGVIDDRDSRSVSVICETNRFLVSANVTGLTNAGLVIENNGRHGIDVVRDGLVTFNASFASGEGYAVAVRSHPWSPEEQVCTVSNGSGSVGSGNVVVNIACAPPVSTALVCPSRGTSCSTPAGTACDTADCNLTCAGGLNLTRTCQDCNAPPTAAGAYCQDTPGNQCCGGSPGNFVGVRVSDNQPRCYTTGTCRPPGTPCTTDADCGGTLECVKAAANCGCTGATPTFCGTPN